MQMPPPGALGAPSPAGMPAMAAPIGGIAPPPQAVMMQPVPGAPSMGAPLPVAFGAPPPMVAPGAPPGMVAPPPMVSGGVAGGVQVRPPPPAGPPVVPVPGAVAPPPFVAPPPMIPGAAPAPAPMPAQVPAQMVSPPGSRGVLVGFLVTFQNDPGGSFWAIYSGRTQMGRSVAEGGPDIPLSDASASSRHASIHADPATGQAFIDDDGSRNGTFLNDQRLTPGDRRQLRDNDRLRLGSTTFVVKLLVS
jgi:hypothetical protein